MAKQIQLRRGTTTEHDTFTGAVGELTYDTEKKQLRVHDGSTVGGKVVDDTTRDVTSQVSNATETVAGKAEIATQAETNTGTDDLHIVTPKKLLAGVKNHLNVSGNAPMFACRAWLNFDGSGGVTINGSGNILSVVRASVGRFTINFTAPMPISNYSVVGIASKNAANSTTNVGVDSAVPQTTSSVSIIVGNSSAGADAERILIGVFC